MAEQSRGKFHLDMSTEELMGWLRQRGLGEEDLEIVKGHLQTNYYNVLFHDTTSKLMFERSIFV